MKKRIVFAFFLNLIIVILVSASLPAPSKAGGELTGIVICIDPGHGGADPGATNITYDLLEKDINLDVSYGLKYLLESSGASVGMTREEDSYLENADRYTFCNELQATILVSVHTNSVTDPTWDGSMALYFRPDQDDQVLAQSLYDVLYPYLIENAPDPENFNSFGLDWFASGVLLKSDMPAAMMEPLFMSNPGEAQLLVQQIYSDPGKGKPEGGCQDLNCRRGQIARAIHLGILCYFENHPPEPTPVPSGEIHVESIDLRLVTRGPNNFLTSDILIVDSQNIPVPDVDISLTITQPDMSVLSISSTTGIDGIAAFKIRAYLTGSYVFEVATVSKAGWEYNPGANLETSDYIVVP